MPMARRPAGAAFLRTAFLLCCVATTAAKADALSAAYRYLIIDAVSDAALAAAVAGLS